jgi:molecular chaperone GrpE
MRTRKNMNDDKNGNRNSGSDSDGRTKSTPPGAPEESGKLDGGGDGDPSVAAPATPAELPEATPEERLAALQAERDETKDRMLRIAADFENWKKRARKEQSDAVAQARETVLRDMLEVIDSLERATSAQAGASGNGAPDSAAVLKGVNLVLRLFQQKLERYDVRPFEAKGQAFDPHQHEAISRVPSDDVPAGAVVNELQKGYRVGDRLLRAAMVAVSSGPKPSEG